MADLIIQNSRVVLTCGAKNSGAITSIVLDGTELLSFENKSEGAQNKWRFASGEFLTICNEAGAASEAPGDDSSSRFISSNQTDDTIITSTYTAYNAPLVYDGVTLTCSANRLDKKIKANILGNPGIFELESVYDIYSVVANETFSWSFEANLVDTMRNFFLFDAQPLGVGLPAGAPQVIGVTTEDGISIPRNLYGGLICTSVDQNFAFGIYTHNAKFDQNTLYHRAVSAQLIDPPISTMSVQEMNAPNLRTATGQHKYTHYLCVGTFNEVLQQFVQLYNHLTNTVVLPPSGSAVRLSVAPQQVNTSIATVFTATVTAVNAFGGIDDQYTGDVTVALSGSGTLSGTLTKTCVAGIAIFNDLEIDAAGQFTLQYMSGTLTQASQSVTINNIAPFINLLNPSSALQGAQQFTMNVFGGDFAPNCYVTWNGQARSTVRVGEDQLTVTIPAGDVFTAGTAAIKAVNPAPGGGRSNSLLFTIVPTDEPLVLRDSYRGDYALPVGDILKHDLGGANEEYLVGLDTGGFAILDGTVGTTNTEIVQTYENTEGAPTCVVAQSDATTGAANKRMWVGSGRERVAVRLSDAERQDAETTTFSATGDVTKELIWAMALDETNNLLYTLTKEGGLYCEDISTPSTPTEAATPLDLGPYLLVGEALVDVQVWSVPGEEVVVVASAARLFLIQTIGGALTVISQSDVLTNATDTNPDSSASINNLQPRLIDRIKLGQDNDGKLVAYAEVQCTGYELQGLSAPSGWPTGGLSRPFAKCIFLADLDLANSYIGPKFKQTVTSGANAGTTYFVFYNPFPVAPTPLGSAQGFGPWGQFVLAGGLRADGSYLYQKSDYTVYHFRFVDTGTRQRLYVAHGRRNQVKILDVSTAFTTGITVFQQVVCNPLFGIGDDSIPPDIGHIDVDPNAPNRFVVYEYRNGGARLIDKSVTPATSTLLEDTRFDQGCIHDNAIVALPGAAFTVWCMDFRFPAFMFRVLDASGSSLSVLYEKGWPMAIDGIGAVSTDHIYTTTFGGINHWLKVGPDWILQDDDYKPNRILDPYDTSGDGDKWLDFNTEQLFVARDVSGVGDNRLIVASGAGGFMEYIIDPGDGTLSDGRFFAQPNWFQGAGLSPDPSMPGWEYYVQGRYYTNAARHVVIDGVSHIIADQTNRELCQWGLLAWRYNSGTDEWDFVTAAIVPVAVPAYTVCLTSFINVSTDSDYAFVSAASGTARTLQGSGFFIVRLSELVTHDKLTVTQVNLAAAADPVQAVTSSNDKLFVSIWGPGPNAARIELYDFDLNTGTIQWGSPIQTLTSTSLTLPTGHVWKEAWVLRFFETDPATGSGALLVGTQAGTVLEFLYTGTATPPSQRYVSIDSYPVSTLVDASFNVGVSIRLDSPAGSIDTSGEGSMTLSMLATNPDSLGSLQGVLTTPIVAGVGTFSGLSIDAHGTYEFTASHTPIPGGSAANPFTTSSDIAIYNPRPILSAISPSASLPKTTATVLDVFGARFVNTHSVINFNGTERATNFLSSAHLTTRLSTTDIATSGSYPVFVTTVGAATPNSANTINMLVSPNAVPTTFSPATDLVFVQTPTSPTYVNQAISYTVAAVAPSGTVDPNATGSVRFDISPGIGWTGALVGNKLITLVNGFATFDGNVTDEGSYLFKAVHSPLPATSTLSPVSVALDIYNLDPIITRVSPNPIDATAGVTGLAIFGSNFARLDATGTFNGLDRTTTWISTSQLIITLNPGDIAAVGTHSIGVYNEFALNAASPEVTLTVQSPTPATAVSAGLSSVSVDSNTVNANGSEFITVTVILKDGTDTRVPFRFLGLSTDTELNCFEPTYGWTDGNGEFTSTFRVLEPGNHSIVVNADDGAGGYTELVDQPVVTCVEATNEITILTPRVVSYTETGTGKYGSADSLAIRHLTNGDYEVYVTGSTNYQSLISTIGVTGNKTTLPASTGNAWIGRLDSDLNWLNATYFGGSNALDAATGITISDDFGNNGVFVTGTARSGDFPHGNGTLVGPYDAWMANFSFDLSTFNWSTILGPYSSVGGNMAIDATSTPPVVYTAGMTKYFVAPTPPAPSISAQGTKIRVTNISISLNAPAGTHTGKVLLAVIAVDEGARTVGTLPANWTIAAQERHLPQSGDSGQVLVVCWARWDVVGSGPHAFVFDQSATIHGMIFVLDGCVASGDPVLTVGTSSGGNNTVNMSAPSIAPTRSNCLVFWLGASAGNHTASGYSGTNPAFTEVLDGLFNSGNTSIHLATGVQTTAATTGARTATLNTATEVLAFMFAIQPVVSAYTTTWPRDTGTLGDGVAIIGGNSDMALAKVNAQTGAILLRTSIGGESAETDTSETDTFEGGILISSVAPNDLVVYGSIASTIQSPSNGYSVYNTFHGTGVPQSDPALGDALIISLTNDFSLIPWSRYIGSTRGNQSSRNRGLHQAANGDLIVCGVTGHGTGFDITASPYQDHYMNINSPAPTLLYYPTDAFVMRLSSDGATVKKSTYFGGYYDEVVNQVIEDRTKRIWVVGRTDSQVSTTFPRVEGDIYATKVFANTPTTGTRGLVACFDSNLEFLRSAFVMPNIGSTQIEEVTGIANPKVGEWIICGKMKSVGGRPGGLFVAKLLEDIPTSFSSPSTGPSDFSPPLPDPATWLQVPYAVDDTTISMQATAGIDVSSPVEYYFGFTGTAAPGQVASGWQASDTYTLGGLTASTLYSGWYVQTRDAWGNETAASSPTLSVYTQAGPDVLPPTPDPSTWAVPPFATSTTSISMTATTATDPAIPVQYSFENLTVGGHNSGWQNSPTWIDTGLTPGVAYTYRHQTRDSAVTPNVGSYSSSLGATTPSSGLAPTMAAITICPENNDPAVLPMVWPHMISVRSTVDGHGLAYIVTVEIAEDFNFTVNVENFDVAQGDVTATQAQDGPRKVGRHIWDRQPNKTYYIRFKAVSSAGTSYSPVLTQTTPAVGLTGPVLGVAYVKTQATQKSATEIRPKFEVSNHTGRRFAWRYELATDVGITNVVETIEGFYDGPSLVVNGINPRAEFWWSFINLTPNSNYWLKLTCWNANNEFSATRAFTTEDMTNWKALDNTSIDQKIPPNRWGWLHSNPRDMNSALIGPDTPMVMGADVYNGNHNQHSTAGFGGGLAGEDAYTVYVDGTGYTKMWMLGQPGAFTASTDSGKTGGGTGTSNIAKAVRALKGIGGIVRVAGSLTDTRANTSDLGWYRCGTYGGVDDRTTTTTAASAYAAYWDNGSGVNYPIQYVRVQAANINDKPKIGDAMLFTDSFGGCNGIYFRGFEFWQVTGVNNYNVFFSGSSDFAGGMAGFYDCFFTTLPTNSNNADYGRLWDIKATGNWSFDVRRCQSTPAREHLAYVNSIGALGIVDNYFIDNEVLDAPWANLGGYRANGRTMFQADSRGDLITAGNQPGTQTGLAPGRGDIYFLRNIARSGTPDLAGSLSIPGHRGRVIIEDHVFLGNPDPSVYDAKFMNSGEDTSKGTWMNENGFAVNEVIIRSSAPGRTIIQVNNTNANQFIIQGTEFFTVEDAVSVTMNNRIIYAFTEDLPPGQARTCGTATLSWAGTANDALRTSSAWPTNISSNKKVRHEFYGTNTGNPKFDDTVAGKANFNILSKGFVFEAIV